MSTKQKTLFLELVASLQKKLATMSAVQVTRILIYASGRFKQPLCLNYTSHPKLQYHHQEVTRLHCSSDCRTITLELTISGLLGACGMMPNHYVHEALSQKHPAVMAFFKLLQAPLLKHLIQAKNHDPILQKRVAFNYTLHPSQRLPECLPSLMASNISRPVLEQLLSQYLDLTITVQETTEHYHRKLEKQQSQLSGSQTLGHDLSCGTLFRLDHNHFDIILHLTTQAESYQVSKNTLLHQQIKIILTWLFGITVTYKIRYIVTEISTLSHGQLGSFICESK